MNDDIKAGFVLALIVVIIFTGMGSIVWLIIDSLPNAVITSTDYGKTSEELLSEKTYMGIISSVTHETFGG